MIRRLFRLLLVLVLLAVLGLIGYAYSGFMAPEGRTVSQPVELDGT